MWIRNLIIPQILAPRGIQTYLIYPFFYLPTPNPPSCALLEFPHPPIPIALTKNLISLLVNPTPLNTPTPPHPSLPPFLSTYPNSKPQTPNPSP